MTLEPGRWYTWEMLPGYTGPFNPYVSPIRVDAVTPMKTGTGLLRLAFLNAAYAQGVQDFELTLRILKRAPAYLIAEIQGEQQRAAVTGEIGFAWLQKHFAHWGDQEPADMMPETFRIGCAGVPRAAIPRVDAAFTTPFRALPDRTSIGSFRSGPTRRTPSTDFTNAITVISAPPVSRVWISIWASSSATTPRRAHSPFSLPPGRRSARR